ncbi:MAG: amidohydrolase family protein, partial [Chromatocurvus sp.]
MPLYKFLSVIIASATLCSSIGHAGTRAADRLLLNGKIYTPDGRLEALAIRDGVIVAVGTTEKISTLGGADTAIDDLGGAAVFPGLHDMHVHPVMGGLAQQRCLIPQELPLPRIQARVAACVGGAAPGQWIQGGQWDVPAIGQMPTKAMLEPYAGKVDSHRDSSSDTGMLLIAPGTLNAIVTGFDAQGLTVKFHAAGDAAVRAGLDAVRAARAANGFSSQLHTIGHNTFVHPDDIAAARD